MCPAVELPAGLLSAGLCGFEGGALGRGTLQVGACLQSCCSGRALSRRHAPGQRHPRLSPPARRSAAGPRRGAPSPCIWWAFAPGSGAGTRKYVLLGFVAGFRARLTRKSAASGQRLRWSSQVVCDPPPPLCLGPPNSTLLNTHRNGPLTPPPPSATAPARCTPFATCWARRAAAARRGRGRSPWRSCRLEGGGAPLAPRRFHLEAGFIAAAVLHGSSKSSSSSSGGSSSGGGSCGGCVSTGSALRRAWPNNPPLPTPRSTLRPRTGGWTRRASSGRGRLT